MGNEKMNCLDCNVELSAKIGYYQDDKTGHLYCLEHGSKYPDAVNPIDRPNRKIPNPRVAALDPGRQQDSFAMVGVEVIDRITIKVIGATQWKHQEYDTVEKQIKIIQTSVVKRPFNYIGVETNNSGWHVIEALRKLNLPITPINTVGKVTDPKTIKLGNSMAKNEIVAWVRRKFIRGEITFPLKDSAGTLALKNQLPKFTRKLSVAGNIQYSAQGKEHDDLVMAFLIACYIARRKYLKTGFDSGFIQTSNYGVEKSISDAQRYLPEVKGFNIVTDVFVNDPR